jgi:hypothetical protein
MSNSKTPTRLEKVTGSVATESALTILSAVVGGTLTPLLPVLTKSLASERQKARIEGALSEMNQLLEAQGEKIQHLSDEQYKVINETVLALLQTTQTEKLIYLRSAVENVLGIKELHHDEAVIISRIIRDISAEEAAFVVNAFKYDGVQLFLPEKEITSDNVLRVDPKSKDALIVSGLLSLGLLVPGESTFGGPNVLRLSTVVAKLIVLLRAPKGM